MNPILIVGAGIAGLALARQLSEIDQAFILIEKAPRWRNEGSGICLPANAVEGFKNLGLKEALLGCSHQVKQIIFAKANGKIITEASLLDSPLNQQEFVALPRTSLMQILQAGMEEHTKFSTEIEHIKQYEEHVEVTFNNGESADFSLVVAADGIHSATRNLIFNEKRLDNLEVTNWRFIVEQDTRNLQPTYYVGKDEAFMRYPIGPNQVYCYAQKHDPHGRYKNYRDAFDIKPLFSEYCSDVTDSIAQAGGTTVGRLYAVRSREVFKGRVLLLGDALHGCPPSLQQGVGMALEDVACLVRLLRINHDIASILAQFKRERLPRISWVIDESIREIKLAAKGKYLLGRIIRNFILRKGGPANVVAWKKLLTKNK
jgi:2-polyprenyl-6-methoxyphenol hydroxylase-like FAD-dependent oxidoreductase